MSGRKISAIIADDEPFARLLLRRLLEKNDDIEIAAECANGSEAVAAIQSHSPDLIFLDVQMPEMDGFAVLREIGAARMPHVVFVTAFDQYALKAFEVRALDYLLKPFDEDRFNDTLQRARERINGDERDGLHERILDLLAERETRSRYSDRFIIKTDDRVFFIRADQVEWIEAQGNYVYLHADKEKYLLRHALTALEQQLDPRQFQRIQRGAVVNVDAIRELLPWFRGEYRVILKSGAELKLNRRYRDAFQRHGAGAL